MAKKLILQIEDDVPNRIAIRTSLEGYRLMYFFNKELNTHFSKVTDLKELSVYRNSETNSFFQVFHWKDELHHNPWVCIKNKLVGEQEGTENSLFETISSVSYWDNKYKDVNFILEIGDLGEYSDIEDVCFQLGNISGVSSVQII